MEKRAMLKQQLVAELSKATEAIGVLTQQLKITQQRIAHLEIELAQARVSRDSFKTKYESVKQWMIEHVQLKPKGGAIVVIEPTDKTLNGGTTK